MPPATQTPRTTANKVLLALIVMSVTSWLASFVAVTVDPAGQTWKWLVITAVALLFAAVIATLITIRRRERT